MSLFYLIDYENVREYGISSLPPTENTDHIYVFYTDNASKLNMDAMLGHEAELKFIKVAAGKQSLDMHLVSVLGFLLRDRGAENTYIVVSRDNGFDNVINFWKSKGFSVGRHTAAIPTPEAEERQEKPEEKKKSKKTKRNSSDKKKTNKKAAADETVVTEEAPAAEETPVAEEAVVEEVAEETSVSEETPAVEETEVVEAPVVEESTVVEVEEVSVPEETPAVEEVQAEESASVEAAAVEEVQVEEPAPVKAATVEETPVAEAAVVKETKVAEEVAQETVQEAAPAEEAPVEEAAAEKEQKREMDPHTLMNNKLMGLLRNKIEANTLGAIASIVIRNMDVKNYKQVIYRAMVKKFGQKQGLEYYNMIKKEI